MHFCLELTSLLKLTSRKSLSWTGSYKEEEERTLQVGSRGNSWDTSFVEVFDLLGCPCRGTENRAQETEKTLRKGMGRWWRDGYTFRTKSVFLRRKCDRVVFERECQLALEYGESDESQATGIKGPATDAQTENESRRRLGGLQEKDVVGNEGQMEDNETIDDGREERREDMKDHGLGYSWK